MRDPSHSAYRSTSKVDEVDEFRKPVFYMCYTNPSVCEKARYFGNGGLGL